MLRGARPLDYGSRRAPRRGRLRTEAGRARGAPARPCGAPARRRRGSWAGHKTEDGERSGALAPALGCAGSDPGGHLSRGGSGQDGGWAGRLSEAGHRSHRRLPLAAGPSGEGDPGDPGGPRAPAAGGGEPLRCALDRVLGHLHGSDYSLQDPGRNPDCFWPERGPPGPDCEAGPQRGAEAAAVGPGHAGELLAAVTAAGAGAGPPGVRAVVGEAVLLLAGLHLHRGLPGEPNGAGGAAAGALGALRPAGAPGGGTRPWCRAGGHRAQPRVEGGGAAAAAEVGRPPEPGGGVSRRQQTPAHGLLLVRCLQCTPAAWPRPAPRTGTPSMRPPCCTPAPHLCPPHRVPPLGAPPFLFPPPAPPQFSQ